MLFQCNTTGTRNVALGVSAVESNTTGNDNIGIGHDALKANTTSNNNIAIGKDSLKNNTGSNNTSVGTYSANTNTTGESNVAVGHQAHYYNTTGSHNVAVGKDSLLDSTTGGHNTAVGDNALANNTTGAENTSIGHASLLSATTGNYNTAVGLHAGKDITTGSDNVCLGYKAGRGQITTSSNQLYIARDSTAQGNAATWLYGDGSGNVVQGNNATAWSQASDERIKKNIVNSSDGLVKINALQVRNFEYRTEDEITVEGLTGVDKSGVQVGAIAQEVETVFPSAIHTGNGTQKQLKTDPIFWAMVKAIQELSAKNEALLTRIEALEG